jgi:nucleotide-binding universal stress UspA family protein
MSAIETETNLTTKLVAVNRILFAADFSCQSSVALPYVLALARRYEAKVFLAHVVPTENYVLVSPETGAEWFEEAALQAREQLDELSGQFEGIPKEELVAQGGITDTLLDMIEEKRIDLVVVGTHGHRGLKRVVLGSVAEEVFRNSPCPVLTVGPHVSLGAHNGTAFRNVLFPTDLSKESFQAAPYALSLSWEYATPLTVVHVLPLATATQTGIEALASAFRQNTKALLPAEAAPWCDPEYLVGVGGPVETILRVAREQQAGLIVLGVKRAGPLASHRTRNVAYRIVAEAECPVLTVPEVPGPYALQTSKGSSSGFHGGAGRG